MTDMNQSPRTQMIASVKQDAAVISCYFVTLKIHFNDVICFYLQYAPFRKIVLGIYVLLNILIVISLILLIVLAPIKDFKSLFNFSS